MVLYDQTKHRVPFALIPVVCLFKVFIVLFAPLFITSASKAQEISTTESPNDPASVAWSQYKKSPYSQEAFRAALPDLGRSADDRFGEWYISGVFIANRTNLEPVYAIQIYDGTTGSFRLGQVAIVSSKGSFISALNDVRVQSNFLSNETERAVQLEYIGQLPDFNADGFSEVPTERWDSNAQGTATTGESTLIYSTRHDIPELIFQIRFPWNVSDSDSKEVDFIGWHLARDPESRDGLAVKARLILPLDEEGQKQWTDKMKQQLRGITLSSSPNKHWSFRVTRSFDETQPSRVMATFNWSSDKNAFVGPKSGPKGKWQVITSDSAALDDARNNRKTID